MNFITQERKKVELSSMDTARAVGTGELPTLGEDHFRKISMDKARRQAVGASTSRWVRNAILFPFRGLFNTLIIALAVSLQILWLVFLFGSVIGVVLLLIFLPGAFLLPLSLLENLVSMWD